MIFSTLGSHFANMRIQQSWCDLMLLSEFLAMKQPDTVIELGTGTGALAYFFALHCNRVITYDITTERRIRTFDSVIYRKLDIIADWAKVVKDFRGKVFVFCDNGNKPVEFELYAKLIRPGDTIGVHDYGTEITRDHVTPVCAANNLISYDLVSAGYMMYNEFPEKSLIRLFKKG